LFRVDEIGRCFDNRVHAAEYGAAVQASSAFDTMA
jgi:hypothetical protein